MDKKLERSNAGKVLRRFATAIKPLGFLRTKPTFFVRESGPIIEFLHIHKYTFGPCFRMHVCLRVLNEPKDFVALAGPTERELSNEARFEYTDDPQSVECCAEAMSDFVSEYADSWFRKWTDREQLLGAESPLYDDQKAALSAALSGETDFKNVEISRSLLKIA